MMTNTHWLQQETQTLVWDMARYIDIEPEIQRSHFDWLTLQLSEKQKKYAAYMLHKQLGLVV